MKDRRVTNEQKKICPLHHTEKDTTKIKISFLDLFDSRNTPLWPSIRHRCQVTNACDMRQQWILFLRLAKLSQRKIHVPKKINEKKNGNRCNLQCTK